MMRMGKDMKRILDLHTHILPAMEDGKGPQTMAESVQMIKDLVASGITDIFCTPKVNILTVQSFIASVPTILDNVRHAVAEQDVSATLHKGAVVELSDSMIEYIRNHREALVLGNSHFMLVTIPADCKLHHVDAWLQTLCDLGITPIINEVERYSLFFRKPELLLAWVDKGILFECNIMSFEHHSEHYTRAIELYTNGLIHFFGTGYDVLPNQYGSYVEVISKLDMEYKKDLLGDVRLNERDLLADRVFYPTVPDHWAGRRPNFWTRLLALAFEVNL